MQTHDDSGSPIQQETPGFCCQPYDGENRSERSHSESPQSSSPSSPLPDQIYGRLPASQGAHAEEDTFKVPSATEKFSQYSYEDSSVGTCGRFLKSSLRNNPFHPYKRQFSEEAFPEAHQTLTVDGHLFKTASLDGFEEMSRAAVTGEAEMYITHIPSLSSEPAWCNGLQYNNPGQEHHPQHMDTDVELKTTLEELPSLYCYQPQVPEMYCSTHPFHQYPAVNTYPVTYISTSHYPYQSIAPQSPQEHHQQLFPKPIYSYSILIFMALRSSKTGSLPVSEIYNFMTEHFPYFKTAPDGWKNSVRHNLSLNKCFEKVENKSGSSSRKGCLWALNPAKIDKMQEELQKWKRKDPIAVRKSMAKPEELDTLIGHQTDKPRSSALACNPTGMASPPTPSRQMPLQHHPLCEPPIPSSTPHAAHAQGALPPTHPPPSVLGGQQTSCYGAPPPGFPQISPAFMHQGQPDGPQTLLPSADAQNGHRGQDSPVATQLPLGRQMKMLAAARPLQDVLAPEGDLSNDVDALSPSLTDFNLQGNLWEELKVDSLAIDPLVLISSSLAPGHCSSAQHQMDGNSSSLPDLQLTTLYSAFMELDTKPTSYLNNSGSKPVALV
ncbi:forkhead box protein N1 [Rhineura floridana]|uniref:forkhead box protein N1 n=1 Tax=Rhineura floridana TaxID=261503 RepID=UPI002AC82BF5|nr:forkhead box protein N1 [Rhineura floridana]XP_061461472.1 forkhead box protein N1 [Rhineura floridana]